MTAEVEKVEGGTAIMANHTGARSLPSVRQRNNDRLAGIVV